MVDVAFLMHLLLYMMLEYENVTEAALIMHPLSSLLIMDADRDEVLPQRLYLHRSVSRCDKNYDCRLSLSILYYSTLRLWPL